MDESKSVLGFGEARREVDASGEGVLGSNGEEVLSAWHRAEAIVGAQEALLDGRRAEWMDRWMDAWIGG